MAASVHRVLSLPLLLALLVTAARAETLYVDDNAPEDPGPGDTAVSDPLEDGSAQHPFDAIAEAVAVARPDDLVLVRDGRYAGVGNRDIVVGTPLRIHSERGAASCLIDLEGAGIAFTLSAPATLRGFTLCNGGGVSGGAVRVLGGSAPRILECVFRGNFAASEGGALYLAGGSAEVRHCVFLSNSSSSGGAVSVRLGAEALFSHCTFTTNTALFGGAVFAADSSHTTLANSILWGDDGAGGSDEIHIGPDAGGVTVTVVSSDVQGGAAGAIVEPGGTLAWSPTNIDSDPQFVSFGEVHLLPTSPARDLGDPAFVDVGAADFEGDPVQPAQADLGADEYRPRFWIGGQKVPGLFISLNVVGTPGDPILLVLGTSVLDPPLHTQFGGLELVPLVFAGFGSVPAGGYAWASLQLPADAPSGVVLPWQALIGSELSGLEVLLIE